MPTIRPSTRFGIRRMGSRTRRSLGGPRCRNRVLVRRDGYLGLLPSSSRTSHLQDEAPNRPSIAWPSPFRTYGPTWTDWRTHLLRRSPRKKDDFRLVFDAPD